MIQAEVKTNKRLPDSGLTDTSSHKTELYSQFSDSLIHRGNKWHTMHDKPGQDRPKSAGLARMESDSSTERDRDHQQSHQQSHHHHQHRSRPRSRARFGANNKHR